MMNSLVCRYGLVLITSFLLSCSTLKHKSTLVILSKQASYLMQPVPTELAGSTGLQKLKVTAQNNHHELLLQTELQQGSMQMVGFSLSGIQLFQLTWQNGSDLVVTQNLGFTEFPAQQLLAYYQLSNWPINSITLGLSGMKASVINSEVTTRQFFENEEVIFSIVKNELGSVLTHHLDEYKIEIENLD